MSNVNENYEKAKNVECGIAHVTSKMSCGIDGAAIP